MAVKNILWFSEIGIKDIPLVGGKGASLGEMSNAKFPIPPGFVVTAQAYFAFLEETGLKKQILQKLERLDVENTQNLENVSKEIRQLIDSAEMGEELKVEIRKNYAKIGSKDLAWLSSSEEEFVAVRSSATAEDLPSISANEFVLAKINGKPFFDTVENLHELLEGKLNSFLEIPAMKGNKIEWLKAKSLFRHKANRDILYKIITATGREIVISPNHTLIVLDEENLKPKTVHVSDIGKGAKVPVTGAIPELNCEQTINVLDYVNGTNVVVEKNLVMVKNNSNNWKIQHGLPKELIVSENLAYFLGHYLAEGSTYKNNMVSITNTNGGILKKIENFLKQLGVYRGNKINKHSARAYCPALVRFLHETCGKPLENKKGKGKLCYTKKVPNFVFGWGKKSIGAFLRGCFDGDGTVSSSQISYCTTSKILAGGIVKLLEILEINCYFNRKKNAINVVIPQNDVEKFCRLVGFEDEGKKSKLGKLIEDYNLPKKHPEFKYNVAVSSTLTKKTMEKLNEKLPKEYFEIGVCKKCNQFAEQTSYYKNKKRYYCKNCKKSFYEPEIEKKNVKKYICFDSKGHFAGKMIPWNYGHMQGKHSLNELRKKAKQYGITQEFEIFNGTVNWDTVKEIIPVKYDGWVYDFEVPEEENFAAGLGGIITHNSASFAGQQETYLNIRGRDKVVEAVKKCWSSLFTPRAIYYRQKQNFDTAKVGIAVVVQKMVNSEQSGIMFTANPMGDKAKIIIEAGFGLGETIVSGSVTPDHYVVDKKTLDTVEKKIQKQEWMLVREKGLNKKVELDAVKSTMQKISEDKIFELAQYGKKIEEHYGMPQDIEWAVEGKKVYIVQSRAITTLGLGKNVEREKAEEKIVEESKAKVLIKGLGASPGIVSGKVTVVPEIEDVAKVKEGGILVTKMTSPDWVPIMKKSIAIVTNEGGITCHASIVSRELQIPCVVGTSTGTNVFKDGQIVTVNGYNGEIYEGEIKVSVPEQQKFEKEWAVKKDEIDRFEKAFKKEIIEQEKLKKIETAEAEKIEKAVEEFEKISVDKMDEEDVVAEEELLVDFLRKVSPKVKVNVALPEAAEHAAQTGADGIGLLRAEHMITASGIHPAQYLREGKFDELKNVVKEGIRKVVQYFKDKPVWYRTFDARTDEFMHLKGGELEPKESNPMLGWHGIRRDLDETDLLKAQLIAIKELHEEGFTKLGVMLPFVQNSLEVKKAKELAQSWGIEFGKGNGKIIFGIMVETPASVWTIDEMIEEGINFVSFGTNDLTQLTLGIDRNNEHIQKWFNENQPQILRQLEYVIGKCKKACVETSICGQAASNPEMVKKLVRFGIDSVSANIDAVEKIRQTVLIETKKLVMEKTCPTETMQ